MIDFATARRRMVDGQVRVNNVTDLDVITAMLELPRESFVPAAQAPIVYSDGEIRIDAGRSLLTPMVLAKLVQEAGVEPGGRVLDVACGMGYSSALLARLGANVVALEDDAERERRCAEALARVRAENVTVVRGPLDAGWPELAPYDVILVNGRLEVEPLRLFEQLKEDGRLLGVFGSGPLGKATIYRREKGEVGGGRPLFDAAAPVLPAFARPPAFVF
jgi:protein-L-isoaspartate(D-aspartate) O-methyltransferase